jgi:hypothetical protein
LPLAQEQKRQSAEAPKHRQSFHIVSSPRQERSFGVSVRKTVVFASLCIAAFGVPGLGQIRPDPARLSAAPPELVDALAADPHTYFRFVNRPWIARVCEVFDRDLVGLPMVRLHGDAHVEQFAFTREAWGLDDFDDSARGPALVDIVRFLGSMDLAARRRGWTGDRNALFDRFLEGYRRGLAEPTAEPPRPGIVDVLRARTPTTRAAFLEWGEAKMEPMADRSMEAVRAGMEIFAQLIAPSRPELAPGYFHVTRAGWLRMGVGSAALDKVLIRVQGPSNDPADDELLEVKAVNYLGDLPCLDDSKASPTLRVISGTQQLGRLKHNILAAVPDLQLPGVQGDEQRRWWIRSWDPSYHEIRIADLRSVDDLAALAYDAGMQLGAGSIQEEVRRSGPSARKQALASMTRLEARIRKETVNLVEEVLRGWKEMGKAAR